MRKGFSVVLIFSIAMLGVPGWTYAAAARQGQTGGVQGVAKDAAQQNLSGVKIQLRGPDGQLAATGLTNAQGSFAFAGLNPGVYTIEIVDAAGNIIGTATVTIAAGATATVSVSAAAAGAILAAGGGGVSLFGLGTIGTVAVIGGAAALTTAAIIATKDDASPSR